MREIELVTYFVTAWSPIGGDPIRGIIIPDLDFGIGKNRLPSNYEFSLNLILATRLTQIEYI
ncbi:hypothetical protein BpHYR1_019404 [Brachionus plicatilis]|uniref:Uncharacterized protein n=1 Tax=Brachionus plicatilis TaxID=10195 RepID=A0A3M7SPE9_BRAPC|nr:hypothetical protein BpHYR1_019404 [Brachionus plicatilis]